MAQQAEQQPVFNVTRVYLKDLSVEMPNAPQIFLEQGQPATNVELGVAAEALQDNHYLVSTSATITTKVGDKTLYLVEGTQSGIFQIAGVPADQIQPLLEIVCVGIVYPYLRANLADAITRASMPPIHLTEVNFQALYEAKLQAQQENDQQAAGATAGTSGSITLN
ncbi:hypothetical protein IP84_08305 [beta proteobacterium AAP99]|nr:hypothetical protein IP84_08305 [beta proteobacterium AAP99]